MSARQIHEFRRIHVSLGSAQYVTVDIDVKWDRLDAEDREYIEEIVRNLYSLGGEPR